MDDLPLVREKVSDKMPKHIKATFDKLEQTLQTVQNTQKEMPEKVEEVEKQVLQQDKNCGGGRAAITINIVGIREQEGGRTATEFIKALHL